jgi:murein L,D-transpeptidase YcbB/YkuD
MLVAAAPPPADFLKPDIAATAPPVLLSDAQNVEAFYTARQNAPLWFVSGAPTPAAARLIAILKRANLDGLVEGPQLAAQAEAAIQAAQGGDATLAATADRALSAAWVAYVRALRAPVAGFLYGDPLRRPQPASAAAILGEAAAAASLDEHVKAVSDVNPLHAQLRDLILAQSPGGAVSDRRQLATLERLRMLPATGRVVMVDVAAARLFMIENGQIRDSMKVIVGKAPLATRTPLIASTIQFVTFNPYWHVPDDMVRRTIGPAAQRSGLAYLRRQSYELFRWTGEMGAPLSVSDVNWKAVISGEERILVRQLPGSLNSMGKMKIAFANTEGIYLHDTPNKKLFANAQRTLSHGCIRLEDASRLARWLLGKEPVAPSSAPELHVQLAEAVPIYVTYLTARAESGTLAFADDYYGLDRVSAGPAALAGASR